jgi:hypothetical protein
MIVLPKNQSWVYDEESSSFIPLTNDKIVKGNIIISYNPSMGFKCQPQIINRVWKDDKYEQICFTSVDYEESGK